jgi:drug/metabolite transporter (DMT)-like permease
VTALAVGWVVFSEWPDLPALIGIVLIGLGGLAILLSEHGRCR